MHPRKEAQFVKSKSTKKDVDLTEDRAHAFMKAAGLVSADLEDAATSAGLVIEERMEDCDLLTAILDVYREDPEGADDDVRAIGDKWIGFNDKHDDSEQADTTENRTARVEKEPPVVEDKKPAPTVLETKPAEGPRNESTAAPTDRLKKPMQEPSKKGDKKAAQPEAKPARAKKQEQKASGKRGEVEGEDKPEEIKRDAAVGDGKTASENAQEEGTEGAVVASTGKGRKKKGTGSVVAAKPATKTTAVKAQPVEAITKPAADVGQLHCIGCGASMPEGAKFCPACSEPNPQGETKTSRGKIVYISPEKLVVEERYRSVAPRLSDIALKMLEKSMVKDGQRQEVRFREGDKVLYIGFNRLAIAKKLGWRKIRAIADDLPITLDLTEHIVSDTITQRQLSDWEKADLAVRVYLKEEVDAARKRQGKRRNITEADPEGLGLTDTQQKQLGEARERARIKVGLGSRKMLDKAMFVRSHARPEVLQQLDAKAKGMSITKAYKEAKKTQEGITLAAEDEATRNKKEQEKESKEIDKKGKAIERAVAGITTILAKYGSVENVPEEHKTALEQIAGLTTEIEDFLAGKPIKKREEPEEEAELVRLEDGVYMREVKDMV